MSSLDTLFCLLIIPILYLLISVCCWLDCKLCQHSQVPVNAEMSSNPNLPKMIPNQPSNSLTTPPDMPPSMPTILKLPTAPASLNTPLASSRPSVVSEAPADSFPLTIAGGSTASADSLPITTPGGSTPSTDSYPLTLAGGSTDDYAHVSCDARCSKETNNAAKSRSMAKKERELRDFQYELARSKKLKSASDKKKEIIRKLKAYIKCTLK